MLYEIKNARESDGGLRFRCFSDDFFDLFLWIDGAEIVQFQLVYDKLRESHALTWHRDRGFIHTRVDDGNALMGKKSPILVPDGAVPSEFLRNAFLSVSRELEAPVRDFIHDKLKEMQGELPDGD